MKTSKDSPTVYSTGTGRICPQCGRPVKECHCRKEAPRTAEDGIVRMQAEVAGRGGKTVTTLSGISLVDEELRKLATELKRRCGTGGTVKNGVIEIQGDHRTVLEAEMGKRGYKVKRVGG